MATMTRQRPRKTIEVGPLARKYQSIIKRTESVEVRAAVCSLLTQLLIDTGNYHGYGYFDAEGKTTMQGIHGGEPNEFRRAYYGVRDL